LIQTTVLFHIHDTYIIQQQQQKKKRKEMQLFFERYS